MVINQYITGKKLRNGGLLFSLNRDKKKPIGEPNFQQKSRKFLKRFMVFQYL